MQQFEQFTLKFVLSIVSAEMLSNFTSFLASKFNLVTVPLLGLKYSNYSTGADLIAALENGLSDWPNGEGKFLQVSGIEYGFRPDQPAGSRVDPELVKVQGEYIKLDEVREHSLFTTTRERWANEIPTCFFFQIT